MPAWRSRLGFTPAHRQFNTQRLLKACYENRFDYNETTEDWLTAAFRDDAASFSDEDAERIYDLAQLIGEVDQAA